MKSRTFRGSIAIAVVAVGAIALTACSSSKGSSSASSKATSATSSAVTFNGEIKIGSAVPLSSPTGGPQNGLAAQLAVDRINAKGGVLGKKLVLDEQDIGSTAATGLTAAHTFVQDGVAAVVGYTVTTQNLAASPVFQQAKLINMVGTASDANDFVATGNKYNFIFNVPDTETAAHQVSFALDTLKAKKFALLLDASTFGDTFLKIATPLITAGGGTVVASPSVASTANDLSTQVTKILQAKPDVVLVAIQTPATAELLYKELNKQAPNNTVPLIGATAVTTALGTGIPWASAQGTYATYMTQGMYDPSARPANTADFYKAVGTDSAAKKPPTDPSAFQYDKVLALAAAFTATGGTDSDKVADYLSSLTNFSGWNGISTISGPYTCDPKTHSCLHAQYLGQVKGEALSQVTHYTS